MYLLVHLPSGVHSGAVDSRLGNKKFGRGPCYSLMGAVFVTTSVTTRSARAK